MEETLKLTLNKLNNMDSDIKKLRNNVKNIGRHVLITEDVHEVTLLKVK